MPETEVIAKKFKILELSLDERQPPVGRCGGDGVGPRRDHGGVRGDRHCSRHDPGWHHRNRVWDGGRGRRACAPSWCGSKAARDPRPGPPGRVHPRASNTRSTSPDETARAQRQPADSVEPVDRRLLAQLAVIAAATSANPARAHPPHRAAPPAVTSPRGRDGDLEGDQFCRPRGDQ